jgi:hypothetical protein
MNSNTYDKLSDDVINIIKDFKPSFGQEINFPFYDNLAYEQKSLIDELITNEELKKQYKKYGLCGECSQPNTGNGKYNPLPWCQFCNSKHFQQGFNKWTSGNKEIDEFIQKFQLNATRFEEVLEWIPYEKFTDIEYLAKGGFGTVYKAKWIDRYIKYWNIDQNTWKRSFMGDMIVLKCLNNSQNLTTDFLQEVCNLLLNLLLISYL